ncbi:hypothetical protein ABT052_17850 [Streptomyces sp. NPDC002766]|uniref:hypothetical protein n=1 Tax=Streptomyces sp. NPDC002766 TaxID=3154429 RepID=UPI00332E2D7A
MTLALLGLVGYALLCWMKPFAPCRKCHGIGRIERFGKPRMCPRCHDHKLRLRVGRRLHNAWRRTREAGAR